MEADYLGLWVKLGRPSPERFHAALLKRGVASPGVAWFRENIYNKDAKQIFAPPPKYGGHVYSPHLDERWVADIMVRPAAKEDRYTLVVQDIFSRFAWAEPITSPMQAADGLRAILRRARPPPQILITDEDPGFKDAQFKAVLGDRRIIHEFRVGRNDLATVDRLIFRLKRTMASHEAAGDDVPLQEVVSGINGTGTEVLYGSAPDDFRDGPNNALVFQREWDESHNMLDNAKRIHARARKLQKEGAYRTLEQKGFRRRAGQAIWSRAVHPVRNLQGAFVDGRPTKEVLPTSGEEALPEVRALKHAAREVLLRYALRVSDLLSDEDDVASVRRVYLELLKEAGSRENLQNALRAARVSANAPVASLVKVFPEYFRLEGDKVRFIGDF